MYQNNEQQNSHFSDKFIGAAINILSLSSRIEHFIAVVLKPFHLTLPQFNVLCILASHYPNPIVLKNLTEKMIDKSSNTSRLVDKLGEKKLIIRQADINDRRLVNISITPEGLIVMKKAAEKLELSLVEFKPVKDSKKLEQIAESLKTLQTFS